MTRGKKHLMTFKFSNGFVLYYFFEKNDIYLPVKMCISGCDLNWAAQFKKLKRQGELIHNFRVVTDDGIRLLACMTLEWAINWLQSINRVSKAVRDKIEQRRQQLILFKKAIEMNLETVSSDIPALNDKSQAVTTNTIKNNYIQLMAVKFQDSIFIPLKRFVEDILGMAWKPQFIKVCSDTRRLTPVFLYVKHNDKIRKTLCLPLETFFLWLSSINALKAKESVRPFIEFLTHKNNNIFLSYIRDQFPTEIQEARYREIIVFRAIDIFLKIGMTATDIGGSRNKDDCIQFLKQFIRDRLKKLTIMKLKGNTIYLTPGFIQLIDPKRYASLSVGRLGELLRWDNDGINNAFLSISEFVERYCPISFNNIAVSDAFQTIFASFFIPHYDKMALPSSDRFSGDVSKKEAFPVVMDEYGIPARAFLIDDEELNEEELKERQEFIKTRFLFFNTLIIPLYQEKFLPLTPSSPKDGSEH